MLKHDLYHCSYFSEKKERKYPINLSLYIYPKFIGGFELLGNGVSDFIL